MATGITLSVQYGLAPVSEAGTRLGQTAGHHTDAVPTLASLV
ncbi:hypothetical protein ACLEE6_01665 [Lonsdalea quercina]